MKKARISAVGLLILSLLLWIATITHDTLGFVAPVSAQSIGFDLWGALIWAFFVHSIIQLYRSFRRNEHAAPPLAEDNFETVAKDIIGRMDQRLREMVNNPSAQHHEFVDFLREHGSTDEVEKYRRGLLSQIQPLCRHALSVHLSPQPPQISGTPDSNGSLLKEIQKWAIMASGIKMNRALDIRAAIEVYKPFEELIKNRDYLLAIVEKNAGEDGTPTGKLDTAEYKNATGPEIAYRLIMRANQDMFESEMWAYVAHHAGDFEFLNRYEKAGQAIIAGSLEHWAKQVALTKA